MKSRIKKIGLQFLALFFVFSVAQAQTPSYNRAAFSPQELEQMLAPVALYPDSLLSQILMASTYPAEVVEAAYWLRANPGLQGEAAIQAAQGMPWDISVKSLLPFPNLLNTMEAKYDWMQNLGNAFLGQQPQVMDTVQILRQRAMAAGYLRSDSHIMVTNDGRLVSIAPVQPTVVYVPYYNPGVVYGRWPYASAPVMWSPWPGYPPRPAHAGWTWSPVATVITAGVLFAVFDWHHHQVYHRPQVSYWHRHPDYARHAYHGPQRYWQHDPHHRREVAYRHPAAERRFGPQARAFNARTPRPTVHDIRAGRSAPHPVQRAPERRDDHRKPGDRDHSSLNHRTPAAAPVAHARPSSQPVARPGQPTASARAPYGRDNAMNKDPRASHVASPKGPDNRAASRRDDKQHQPAASRDNRQHQAAASKDNRKHEAKDNRKNDAKDSDKKRDRD